MNTDPNAAAHASAQNDTTLGPLVLLVRCPYDGEPVSEWVPAALAVAALAYDGDNGQCWERAWVVADDVDLGAWDRSV